MSMLAALSSLLVDLETVETPLTNTTGGTSQGDPSAGRLPDELEPPPPVQTKDKVGSSILTILVVVGLGTVLWWMGAD